MLGKDIRFDGSGRYVVMTREQFSPEIIELFSARENMSEQTGEVIAGSHIVVEIKDQSELLSFLNILYDNHHTIVKVELLSGMEDQKENSRNE